MIIVMDRSNKTRSERAQLVKRKRNRLIIITNLVLLSAITATIVLTYQVKQDKSGAELPKLAAVNSKKPVQVDTDISKVPIPGLKNNGDKDNHQQDQDKKQDTKKDTKQDAKQEDKAPITKSENGSDSTSTKPSIGTNKKAKVVYLTFDDGPNQYTDQILDILHSNDIHATFFMIGTQLRDEKSSVERLIKEGHYPGLHSMSHSYNKLYKSGGYDHFVNEFKQEQALLYKLTGFKASLIRAPYGSAPQIGYNFRTQIADAGFKMWDWTVDSKDWNYDGKPDKVVQQVKRQVHRDQEIILMHEKKQTVQALPRIIAYLKQKGYSFAVYKPDHHVTVNFGKDTRL